MKPPLFERFVLAISIVYALATVSLICLVGWFIGKLIRYFTL